MSEETPNIASVNGISEFLQKNGLATMLVLAGLWFVVLPLNDRYQQMLEEVSKSNSSLSETVKELKEGIITIGKTNSENVAINQDMLKDIDRSLEDVEQASKEISRKLDDLRGGRGSYTPPSTCRVIPE
jgi:methyl-accepting chemotaxis protein